MDRYLVKTPELNNLKNKQLIISVPGSKSMTNRALLLATLAEGRSVLQGVLFSDDSRYFMQCVQELGFVTEIEEKECRITMEGDRSKIPKQEASIYVGSAGTAARFLTALLGISPGVYHLDASEQMKKRPMAPLLQSLRELGTEITFDEEEEHFPFTLHSKGVTKREISINIGDSSQFLSALLISCPCLGNFCYKEGSKEDDEKNSKMENRRLGEDFLIHVAGQHGMAYIDMTTRMMAEFGVQALRQEQGGDISFLIPGGQYYKAREYQIEPDISAACYFYAMAMLLGIEVTVSHVKKDTLQGDIQLLEVFRNAGGSLRQTECGMALAGPVDGKIHGVTVDMHSFSDQAITLAAVAPFADSPTTITGIGHIRYQESNRIHAIVTELTKLGVRCEELEDGVRIYPGKVHGGIVSTYEDHRMAMGFSLIGLRVPGIIIDNPMCCRKTFENYFDILDGILKEMK